MNKWKYAVSYAQAAPVTAPLPLCGDIYENLRKAAKYGYAGLEVHGRETVVYDYEKIKKVSDECGAGVATIVTGRLYTEGKVGLLDEPVYSGEAAIEGLKKYIDIARRFQVDVVLGWVKGVIPPGGDRERHLQTLGERLLLINNYGKERGVKIHLEVINHYETNVFNTAAETLDFINRWNCGNCYIHLDTYHMNIEEFDPCQAIRLCGKKLGYFHVADNSRRYPGSGQLDFKSILSALKEADYSGYVTLECLPYPDRDTAVIKAMEHLKKCEP
jgi:sugar phosphate isomerase/epimerase